METNKIILDIDNLKLHDAYLYSMDMKFHDEKIIFNIIRDPKDGVLQINFIGTTNMNIKNSCIYVSNEILKVDCDFNEIERIYSIKFLFLSGTDIFWELFFEFNEIEILTNTEIILD